MKTDTSALVTKPSGAEEEQLDTRPRILLPGDDRLVSEVAKELGEQLRGNLYLHGDEIVIPRRTLLCPVSTQHFRTLVEHTIVCRKRNRDGFLAEVTMSDDIARAVLASDQFREPLQRLERIHTCRLPVMRNGRLELLQEGYDEQTRTLIHCEVEYDNTMSFDDAKKLLTEDLYAEFEWNDQGRSLAVALAGSMTLYAAQLLPEKILRPCFITTKNAEGCGATTLVRLMTAPVLGEVPFKAKPATDDEMRKMITSMVRNGSLSLVLDNISGHLKSPALEMFLTTTLWSDRLLGVNRIVSGPNLCTAYVTGNGLTISPDMGRRSLVIELHQSYEHPGEHIYKHSLDAVVLHKRRHELLAAHWALVREWERKRFPGASRVNSAFPEWCDVVAGIIEADGFACPLHPSETSIAMDEDGADMRELVMNMELDYKYDFTQLVTKCRDLELFAALIDNPMTPSQKSTLGKLLARYQNRLIGKRRFIIKGATRKLRRYVSQIP